MVVMSVYKKYFMIYLVFMAIMAKDYWLQNRDSILSICFLQSGRYRKYQ